MPHLALPFSIAPLLRQPSGKHLPEPQVSGARFQVPVKNVKESKGLNYSSSPFAFFALYAYNRFGAVKFEFAIFKASDRTILLTLQSKPEMERRRLAGFSKD
jgi:hypothetical protein